MTNSKSLGYGKFYGRVVATKTLKKRAEFKNIKELTEVNSGGTSGGSGSGDDDDKIPVGGGDAG